mgnify:CR=1 FL=1
MLLYQKSLRNLNKYVYAVSQYPHPIQRAMVKTKSKKLLDEGRRRTQDFSASLSDDDVGDLFDLIAQEHPDL